MNLQAEKRAVRPWAALYIGLPLATLCVMAALLWSGAQEESPILASAGEYAVLRGAPALTGGETVISRQTLLKGTLLLVSPAHPLPADYPPPDTRTVRALVGGYLPAEEDTALCREAIYSLCTLQTEHPLTGAVFENGAVSAAQQEQARREAFSRFQQVYPLAQALEKARAAVPGGGESEHQTGCAVDVTLTGPLSMGYADPLARSEEGRWLRDNLWRYGFIRRYADGEEDGACEGIHLRYVGPLHAAALHALNTTLEEYLALLRREGALTLMKDSRPAAYLYCAPCQGDWHLPLPEGAEAQCSADNTGWAVAAIPVKQAP